jgi:hypothetical protein
MSIPESTLTIQIKDIKDPSIKRSVMAICSDVISTIYERRIAKIPRLGAKPVVLHQGQVPRARYDGLPDQFNIDLTCLNTLKFNQIVYQFAHELGHFYLYPSDMNRILLGRSLPDSLTPWNNWFIESCCCAMSYLCLDEMAQRWRRRQSVQNNSKYFIKFKKYREDDIQDALKEQLIPSKDSVAEWLQSELPRLTKECTTDDKNDHRVCAIEIERIMKEHSNAWGCLNFLGDATENQHTDFDRWSEMATWEQRSLIKALDKVFNVRLPQ